jgi:DNA-binding NarL/FixJ family response regulator
VKTAHAPSAPRVLVLKADRLSADSLRHNIESVLHPADITVVTSVAAARKVLTAGKFDLFITGLGDALEGDPLLLIAQCKKPPLRARRVLVVTTRCDYRALAALRTLPVNGVFDAAEEAPEAFASALQTVAEGSPYWSSTILRKVRQLAVAPTALFRILTDFEQVVFSVLGDGCDDSAAAQQLDLKPSTISSVRRGLHRKLGIQHRGELVRLAAQQGYVHFTPNGVERPGFALLAAAYHPRDRKQRAPSGTPQTATAMA